ncbi:hypothetical protein B0H14DRAFT_3430333 [Mycena olivaceomarginata]|nr:hypothetical protein B0H14DRAFT_3430333 [Mycena olivaceomarginata]
MTKLIGNATAGVSFGLVSKEHWFQPEWIDEDKARAGRDKMVAQDILYAGNVPPDVEYFCDRLYDPFHFMQQEDKIYGDILLQLVHLPGFEDLGYLMWGD